MAVFIRYLQPFPKTFLNQIHFLSKACSKGILPYPTRKKLLRNGKLFLFLDGTNRDIGHKQQNL